MLKYFPLLTDLGVGHIFTGLVLTYVCWKLTDYLVKKHVYDGWIGFLLKFRWVAVVFIVLPVSKFMAIAAWIRQWHFEHFVSAPEQHNHRVADVQKRVKQWIENGRPGGRLCTARPQWMRMSLRQGRYQNKQNAIPLDLHDILEIDTEKQLVHVEPRVSMEHLTRVLLKHKFTVPVVPELNELTVGGCVTGYGIETSSQNHGLVADAVTKMEILTADGDVVFASPTENADLFYGFPWGYGAHGFLLSVWMKMIPCHEYVRVEYRKYNSRKSLLNAFKEESLRANAHEFIEPILFGPDWGIIVIGDYAPATEAKSAGNVINHIGRWWKPWFYTHARDIARVENPPVEYIPTRDYFHRHTRSIFWEGELILPFGNNPIFRYLLGWMMPLNVGLLKLTQGETLERYYHERHVCQDALVHIDLLEDAVEFFHKNFECYPLWMCSHRLYKTEPQGMLEPLDPNGTMKPGDYEMWVDVGAWYVPGPVFRKEPYSGTERRKSYEKWLIDHKGYQCMYALSEMTRDQWRQMFNMKIYDSLRKRLNSDGVFLDAYDKLRKPY